MRVLFFLLLPLFSLSQIERPPGQRYVLVHPPAPVIPKDTARFNFSRTTKTVSNWVNFLGHVGPVNGSVKTVTMNNITITTISTANWGNTSGNTSYDGFGTQSGVFFTAGNGTNNAVMYNQLTNSSSYSSGTPQFEISGLKLGSTYTIKATGAVNSGSSAGRTTAIRWQGAGAISAPFTYNPGGSGAINTSDGATITGVTSDGAGKILLWMNPNTGSTPGVLCAITIEEN